MSLAYELLEPEESDPRWMLFLHGILGRRANWRSFARRFVERREGWGAALIDLRDHGESQDLPGPRTVAAAGADLVPTCAAIVEGAGGRVAGIVGHSFGGKVGICGASVWLGSSPGAGALAHKPELDELWVVDAPPGPRPREGGLTEQVFASLRSLPAVFDSRSDFVARLEDAGISRRTAQWLATNLIQAGPTWRLGLDLDRLEALVDDFAAVDAWPQLEALSDRGVATTLVLGARSTAVSGEQRRRADALAGAGRLRVEVIPEAGHWVHVDNPEALLELLIRPPS